MTIVAVYCLVVGALVGINLKPAPPLPGRADMIQMGMDPSQVLRLMGKPNVARGYPGTPVRAKWVYQRGVQIDFEDGRVAYVGEVAGY